MKNKGKIVFGTLVVWTCICSVIPGFSQPPEKLIGTWINAKNTRKTDFYIEGNRYFGKQVRVTDDTKVKAGDIIFKDLTWDGKNALDYNQNKIKFSITCSFILVRRS